MLFERFSSRRQAHMEIASQMTRDIADDTDGAEAGAQDAGNGRKTIGKP